MGRKGDRRGRGADKGAESSLPGANDLVHDDDEGEASAYRVGVPLAMWEARVLILLNLLSFLSEVFL